ncbi:MAG: phosphoglucosamine mutase [bacterium]|nr:phosphoglucosamine mutase [bacterium]
MGRLFGTDGVRGKAGEYPMTPKVAMGLGQAGATVLLEEGNRKIIIGKDTRVSSDMLEAALIAGITSTGVDCLRVGVFPTSGVAYLTRELRCGAGIMISASHNPFEDNGIKFFSENGLKLPDEVESRIEEFVFAKDEMFPSPTGMNIGRVQEVDYAKERYLKFLASTVPSLDLTGMKIVVDCANGATSEIAPLLFKKLGAELIALNCEPNGTNINLRCGSLHPEVMCDKVLEHKADIGLSFDGDGDRLISADEQGQIVDGDYIMAICSKFLKSRDKLKNNMLVITVMSNLGLNIAAKELGIDLAVTKVGDRYVMEEMKRKGSIIGGEASGHIIFSDYHTTGDGMLTALQLLRVMKEENLPLSSLRKVMQKFPQITLNLDVEKKPDLSTIPDVQEAIRDAEAKLGDNGRVLVRYSGTQPVCRVMVEGKSQEEINEIANRIAGVIKEKIG